MCIPFSTRLRTQTKPAGQAESFSEAEGKTRRSGITAEVQRSGRQFSKASVLKRVSHEVTQEKQTGQNDKLPGTDRKEKAN